MINFGAVPANSVLPIFFDSFDGGTGASITMTGIAIGDILVYKGTSMTQRASTAGFVLLDTDGIDVDATTGIHGFSIDTGDNTDAGFYAVGSFFTVVVASVTIDAQTVNFVAATFRLVAAEAITGKPKADVDGWLGTACATPSVNGVPEVDLTHVAGATTDVSALATNVAAVLVDTGTTLDGRIPAALTANGNMKCSLMEILTTALTETVGLLAGGFKKFFNVATPTGTLNSLADAVPGAAGGGFIAGSNAATTANITGNITGNLSGSVGSVTGAVGSVTGAVGSVTGAVGSVTGAVGSVTGAVGSIGAGGIATTSFAAGAINAAAIAADAIGASELAADAVAEIADAVWDEDATAHQTLGTFGQAIGDPVADTNTIYKAVVSDATGATVGVDIVTIDDFLDTEIASILAAVDTEVASTLALLDDARTEPGQGAPPVNPDMATKVDYLYKAWRNKKDNNGTTTNLYADDATTVDQKQATSESGGTVTKGEWATGP